MFESGWLPEDERQEKAFRWVEDARLALTSHAEGAGEDSAVDLRFALRLERGIQLSDVRLERIAAMQRRREAFFEAKGVDLVLEQFYALKLGTWDK